MSFMRMSSMLLGSEGGARAGVAGAGVEEVVTETVVIEPGTGAEEAVVEAVVEAVEEAGAVEAVPMADDLDCGTRCAGTPPDCDCLSFLLRLPPFAKTNPAPPPLGCCLATPPPLIATIFPPDAGSIEAFGLYPLISTYYVNKI